MTEPALPPAPRFLTLDDVAAELAISRSQTYALVRGGDLPALKIGGRGKWRVERTDLETHIDTVNRDTATGHRCRRRHRRRHTGRLASASTHLEQLDAAGSRTKWWSAG